MTKAEQEKQHQRQVAISRLKLALIVVCLIAIPVTFVVNHQEASDVRGRIAKVESPCLKYGAKSRLCQESFEKALATLTHPEACAVERKAGTLAAIRALALALRQLGLDVSFSEPCAGARLAQERERGNERASAQRHRPSSSPSPSGGDASIAPTGHSQPAPGNGGSTDHPSKPHAPSVAHQSPAPAESGTGSSPTSTSSTSSQQSSSSTTTTSESTVVEQAPAPVHEAVGGVVEGVGSTITGAVEGVTGTSCSLAKLLCQE